MDIKLKQDWAPSPASSLGKVIQHEGQVPQNLLNVRDRSVSDDTLNSVRCLIVNPLSQRTEVCSLMACLKMCSFNSGFLFLSLICQALHPSTLLSFFFPNLPPLQAPLMMYSHVTDPEAIWTYWLTMYWNSPNWEPEEVLLHHCSQYFDFPIPPTHRKLSHTVTFFTFVNT